MHKSIKYPIFEVLKETTTKTNIMTIQEAQNKINSFLKDGKHEVFKADGFGTRVVRGMQATKLFYAIKDAFDIVFEASENRDIQSPVNSGSTTYSIEFGETACLELVRYDRVYKADRSRNLRFSLEYTYNF